MSNGDADLGDEPPGWDRTGQSTSHRGGARPLLVYFIIPMWGGTLTKTLDDIITGALCFSFDVLYLLNASYI
jgi:hypothetical protein